MSDYRHSAPHHPQTNGVVERFNNTIKEKLLSSLNGREWDEAIEEITAVYNRSYHRTTNSTPYNIFHGRDFQPQITIEINNNSNNNTIATTNNNNSDGNESAISDEDDCSPESGDESGLDQVERELNDKPIEEHEDEKQVNSRLQQVRKKNQDLRSSITKLQQKYVSKTCIIETNIQFGCLLFRCSEKQVRFQVTEA